jgi:hypothetical protein
MPHSGHPHEEAPAWTERVDADLAHGVQGFTVEFMSTSELNGTGSLDAEALVELFAHGAVTGR